MTSRCKNCDAIIPETNVFCSISCSTTYSWDTNDSRQTYKEWNGKLYSLRELYRISCEKYGCKVQRQSFRVRVKAWGVDAAVRNQKPENARSITHSRTNRANKSPPESKETERLTLEDLHRKYPDTPFDYLGNEPDVEINFQQGVIFDE